MSGFSDDLLRQFREQIREAIARGERGEEFTLDAPFDPVEARRWLEVVEEEIALRDDGSSYST